MISRLIFAGLLVGAFICLLALKHNTVEQRCDNLLNFGRWSGEYDPSNQYLLWQPSNGMIKLYDKALISKCLSNRTLFFIGDSTVRQVFWAVAAKHDRTKAAQQSAEAGKHEDLYYREENVTLSFVWDPYLNTSQTKEVLGNPMIMHPRDVTDPSSKSHVAGIIISTGLWHARYSGQEFAGEHRQALDVAAHYTPKLTLRDHRVSDAYLAMTPTIILPPPVLNYHWLNPERAETLSARRLANITNNLFEYQEQYGLEVAWSARAMTMNNSAAIRSGGLHVTTELAVYQAEVMLNRVCNNALFSSSKERFSLPCVRQAPWKITLKTAFELSVLVVVIHCLFKAYQNRSNFLQARSRAVVIMTATVFYCWLADRSTLFDKGNKLVDVRLFSFCTAGMLTASLARLKCGARTSDQVLPLQKEQEVHGSNKTAFLSRELTEEWKGWMQIVILLYHYFGMSKVLPVYQGVRVLVASYLFLTGYGHSAYFLNTKDLSFERVRKVVVRLNLLTCLLSIVMDNNHDLYYFPSLVTIWFLITYAVFWRPKGRPASTRELFARMLAMLSVTFIVIGNERFVELLFSRLHQVHGPNINAREFTFRIQLDILAPFAGMCTAVLEGRIASWRSFPACTRLRRTINDRVASLLRLILSGLGIITYIYIASTFDNKLNYNRWHWILSLLPIAAYVSIRKLMWESYDYFAPILAWIGSISLELFVLQYHVWLAADTKGLLRLGIFDSAQAMLSTTTTLSWRYWLETIMVTVVFLWTSHCCSRATNTLVEWFVGIGDGELRGGRRTLLTRLVAASLSLWLAKMLPAAVSER